MIRPSRQRNLLIGSAAVALLMALLIAWELGWLTPRAEGVGKAEPLVPQAVTLALLGDFRPAPAAALAESIQRPLLIPTRRPAPPPPPPEAKPRMTRGQFVLLGTMLAGNKHFALLRETSGSKQLRVAQGDKVKDMVVDKVEPYQVTLRLDQETEQLPLKTVVAPRRPVPAQRPGQAGPPPLTPAEVKAHASAMTGHPVVSGPPELPAPNAVVVPAENTRPRRNPRTTKDGGAS